MQQWEIVIDSWAPTELSILVALTPLTASNSAADSDAYSKFWSSITAGTDFTDVWTTFKMKTPLKVQTAAGSVSILSRGPVAGSDCCCCSSTRLAAGSRSSR